MLRFERKIVKIGNARGIILPCSWLKWIESTIGQKLTNVTLQINADGTITIKLQGAKNDC